MQFIKVSQIKFNFINWIIKQIFKNRNLFLTFILLNLFSSSVRFLTTLINKEFPSTKDFLFNSKVSEKINNSKTLPRSVSLIIAYEFPFSVFFSVIFKQK